MGPPAPGPTRTPATCPRTPATRSFDAGFRILTYVHPHHRSSSRTHRAAGRAAKGEVRSCPSGPRRVLLPPAGSPRPARLFFPADRRCAHPQHHGLRHLRHRRHRQRPLRRASQLRRAHGRSGLLDGRQEHLLLRPCRRAAVGRRIARGRTARQHERDPLQRFLPERLLRARRDDARRGRRRLPLPVSQPLRAHQLRARMVRHRPGGLAERSDLGDARHHLPGRVEEFRLQHDHLHRRAAEHPRVPLRSLDGRRGERVAPFQKHHAADAGADVSVR